jgi:hypothetical protein
MRTRRREREGGNEAKVTDEEQGTRRSGSRPDGYESEEKTVGEEDDEKRRGERSLDAAVVSCLMQTRICPPTFLHPFLTTNTPC